MNKIRLFFTIALSVFIMNALLPAVAFCLDPAQREALIASLPRGETFENNGWNYAWMPSLKGIQTATGKTVSAVTLNQTAVEQKGVFTIYQTPTASGTLTVMAKSADSGYPIALNLQTSSLAVITGNIWLKLKDINNAATIAKEYGLTLSFANAAMSTAFYQIPAGTDIPALRTSLQADPRIIRVTLDMVDRIRRPQ